MSARKRFPNESFKGYRKSLNKEREQARLKKRYPRMRFVSLRYRFIPPLFAGLQGTYVPVKPGSVRVVPRNWESQPEFEARLATIPNGVPDLTP